MWADLGFWRDERRRRRSTSTASPGPDEYTTVVNDNLFTNVMARFNLRRRRRGRARAARARPGRRTTGWSARLGLDDGEVEEWERAAERDVRSRTTSTSASTRRTRTSWTARCGTWRPPRRTKRPLLLHYHPLVIYRFQVIKQADVVLALFLQGDDVHARGEAGRLRVLRPDHHRRLDAVGGRAVDHRGRGRLPRARAAVLLPGAVRRPGRPARATPATACTWPRPAACGARWSTASAASATTAAPTVRPAAARGVGRALTFRLTLHGTRVRVRVEPRAGDARRSRTGERPAHGPRQGGPGDPRRAGRRTAGRAGPPRLPGGPPVWGRDGVRRSDGTVITASVPHAGSL